MAPKRAATPKKAGRPSKARKTEEAESGPVPGEVREIITALSGVAGLQTSSTCRQMLQMMLPGALGTYRAKRHAFQTDLINVVAQEFEGEKTSREAGVVKLEADAEALRGQEAASATEEEAARAAAATAMAAKEAATAARTAAAAETAEARAALERERTALAEAEKAREEHDQRRAAQQQLLEESWQPLTEGLFVGREWRKRDKALQALQNSLRSGIKKTEGEAKDEAEAPVEVPESLLQGLGAAMKLKPSDRGAFAQKVIDHGKKALDALAEALKAKVTEAEERITAQGMVVGTAESALKAAEEKEEGAMTASIDAENAWAEAETKVVELKDAQQTRSFQGKSLSEKLDAAKAALANIGKIIGMLSELEQREEPPAPEEPAAEEAAADEPAPES